MLQAAIRGCLLLISLLLLGSLANRASAQGAGEFISLQRYGLEQGLSQLAIAAMAEDDQGFLWIATQEGLNRFDGHQFQTYYDIVTDERGIRTSSVNALAVDDQARLWIGTDDAGLAVRDLRSGLVHVLKIEQSPTPRAVERITLDPEGGAWLGLEGAIARVDAELGLVYSAPIAGTVVGMAINAGGQAFALDHRCGFWRLQPSELQALRSPFAPGTRCVGLLAQGERLWLASVDGLALLDSSGALLAQHPAASLRTEQIELSALAITGDQRLIVGFADGAAVIVATDDRWAPRKVSFDQPLRSRILSIFENSAGVLFFGSESRGLFRARSLSAAVRRDLLAGLELDHRSLSSVRSIWGGSAGWLIGTDQGLFVRPPTASAWQSVGVWRLSATGEASALADSTDLQVTDMLLEGASLWVSTRSGLLHYVDDQPAPTALTSAMAGLFLTSLMRDQQGRLWIGSDDSGLFRLDPTGAIENLSVDNGRLKQNSVWSMFEGPDAYWIGTFGGGLNRIDRQTGALSEIRRQEGLSNDVVYRIEPDGLGRLWLSSNRGLNIYQPKTGEIRVLLPDDGLRNREFNSGASFRGAEGLIYFGGTEGVDVIEPDALESSSPMARPVFTTMRILGRRGEELNAPYGQPLQRDLVYAEEISLDYRESVFSLGLVAIDLGSPDTARLRYRIRDLQSDWVSLTQPQTELTLSYLPPGEYSVEAQAAGRVGEFGPSRLLTLRVGAPPWRQPYAHFLYLLIGLGTIAWLASRIGASARAERAQIALLNRTVAERTAQLEQANDRLLHSNRELERASRLDPLTQVSNRRELQRWLQEQTGQIAAAPSADHHLLFFIADIDDFKAINDHYGHLVGDEVLVALAERLRRLCRDQDVVVRWGGEEFLVLVRSAKLAEAPRIAERIRSTVADQDIGLATGKTLAVTCSVGFAPWPLLASHPGATSWEQSIGLADRALYAAKAAGKNAWVGLLPGPALDQTALTALIEGAAPAQLAQGSILLLHSTEAAPEFPQA